MNLTSLNGLSGSYLQSTLANQLTNNKLTTSSQASKNGQPSAFAQMLSAVAAQPTHTAGNAAQSLNQLVSSFQTSGVQNQSMSLDPMSIA